MLQKTLFIPRDLKLIEELVLDPTLEPRFNAISAYLVWDDELPSGITPDGLDVLSSLWTARSLFHRGLTFSDHPGFVLSCMFVVFIQFNIALAIWVSCAANLR
ncbi:hypothetical protein KA344_08570 [bacterium]|jgi:hypothetical protein|nr:hypothetical protein [bacterium]